MLLPVWYSENWDYRESKMQTDLKIERFAAVSNKQAAAV